MGTKNRLVLFCAVVFFIIILVFTEEINNGIRNGLFLCSSIIIPTLFPFTVLSLFIFKSGLLFKNKFATKIHTLIIFLISAIGGYPVGAKIIEEDLKMGFLKKEDANLLLSFCVNAGPSFIISFVGYSVYNSRKIGIILLAAHLISAIEITLLNFKKLKSIKFLHIINEKLTVSDAFVLSVSSAASAIINICAYVILFAGLTSLLNSFSFFNIFKIIFSSFEVTNALLNYKNIYFSAFILGFGGWCINLQVFSITKDFSNGLFKQIITQLFRGVLSVVNLYLLLKIFRINIPTFSNGEYNSSLFSTNNIVISTLMVILSIILIYSLNNKKYCGKFSKDLLDI